MSSEDDIKALLARSRDWSPKAQEDAARMVRELAEGHRRAWYCTTPGRRCDGKPHRGFEYPHARGDQWPPVGQDWFTWFLSGGRGSGKTRTGAEYARRMSHRVGRMALIAPTGADARDTMVEGESGLEFVCALAGEPVHYEPSKRRVTFANGCIGTTFSGEEPNRLRGPQHGFAWLDEPAHIPLIEDVWDNLLFGLRLGERPHVVLTSTPLPTPWVKKSQADPDTRVVRVSTYANLDNLAPIFRQTVVGRYEGTRTGRQELYGEVLEDVLGALWQEHLLVREPLGGVTSAEMDRIVIGVDPAGSQGKRSDLTGIIGAGAIGEDAWVLEDRSGKYSPSGWATAALQMYEVLQADVIVAEKNFGGDMVKEVIERVAKERGRGVPRIVVTTASRSKAVRAEPVVAMYEQKRVRHMLGLSDLEGEQLTWVPGTGPSPNRIDALVWAMTDLFKLQGESIIVMPHGGKLGQSTNRRGPIGNVPGSKASVLSMFGRKRRIGL